MAATVSILSMCEKMAYNGMKSNYASVKCMFNHMQSEKWEYTENA